MSGVVFVTVEDLSKTAGGGIATREIVTALGREADEPLLVLAPEPAGELPDRLTEEVDAFRFLPAATAPGDPRWHLRVEFATLRRLWGVLRGRSPSVVVTRLSPSTLFPTPLARLFGVPHVLLIRGWVNRDDAYDRTTFAGLVEGIVRMNVRCSEAVFVAFDELREWVDAYRSGSQSRARVLPNAVDPDVFAPIDGQVARSDLDLPLGPDAFVVGFAGAMSNRHRIDVLLRAVAENDDVEALLVGDGPLLDDLERLVEKLGIGNRVTFTGEVTHEAVPTYIAACDVTYGVVDPNRPSNPIKVYEYLACERPVITSRSSELAFVEAVDAGVVVESVDVSSVSAALAQLRERPAGELAAMGERGRVCVEQNHTWGSVAETILDAGVR